MRTLHLVVPDGLDDPDRPSGGNLYDRRVAGGLAALGWRVVEHPVAGPWPDARAGERLAAAVGAVPDGAVCLVDGLVGCASPGVLVPAARRLALGVLVHLPLGVDAPERRSAERDVLRACRTVLTTSAWTRDWVADHYGLSEVHVAAPGADPAPVAAGSGTGAALLCVGRAGRAKGYDVLVAALETLADLPYRCTWVGPVDLARPGGADLADLVHLVGPLPSAGLAAHYAAADLLVLPSRGETYGMVLTEALARGVPVLASDVGGVREAIGRTADGRTPGLLVPPGDPAALGDALRSWLTDATLRAGLRDAALERRGGLHGWDDTVARVAAALPAPVGARP